MKLLILILFFVLGKIHDSIADDEKEPEERVGDQTENVINKTEDKVEDQTSENTRRSEITPDSVLNVEKSINTEVGDNVNKENQTVTRSPDTAETTENLEGATERTGNEDNTDTQRSHIEVTTNSKEKTVAEEKEHIEEKVKTELPAHDRSAEDAERPTTQIAETEASAKTQAADLIESSKIDVTEPTLGNLERSALPDTSDVEDRTEPDRQKESDIVTSSPIVVRNEDGAEKKKMDKRTVVAPSASDEPEVMSRSGMPEFLTNNKDSRNMIAASDLVFGSSIENTRRYHGLPSLAMPIMARALPFEPLSGIGTPRHFPGDMLPTYQKKNHQIPGQFFYSPGSYDAKLRGTASLLNSMDPESYNSFKSIVPEARFRPNIGRSQEIPSHKVDPNSNSYPYTPNDVNSLNREVTSQLAHSSKRETDYRRLYGAVDPNVAMRYSLYRDLSRYRRSIASHLIPYYRYRFNNYRRNYNNENHNRNWMRI